MVHGQQPDVRFGGAYAGLDARRQHLVDNWVARFARVTGKPVEPGPFYDDVLTVSTKTTFDAVTPRTHDDAIDGQAVAPVSAMPWHSWIRWTR